MGEIMCFPECCFLQAQLGSNPSYMWRSIMAAEDLVRQGSRRCIGDGEDTKVWDVQWLLCKENGGLTTDMPRQLEHIKVASLMATTKNRLDDDILQDICNERDVGLIKSIPLSIQGKGDSWY